MYGDAAPFYDVIHAGRQRDADREATMVVAELRRRVPNLRSVLDVGCGTGAHLPGFLAAGLEVVGVDPSPQMLAFAAARAPGAALVDGALPDLDLGPDRRFDAVVTLFSVVGYLVEDGELARGVAAMARHLTPGGCLLVEGWVEPEFWLGTTTLGAESVTRPDVALSRTVRNERDGNVTSLHMRYVAATAEGMSTVDEHHRLRLADPVEHQAAFLAAGLTFERLPHMLHPGRAVCVGVRT